MKITATHATYLKKEPIYSEHLAGDQKVFVPQHKIYQVTKIRDDGEAHVYVTLAYGAGSWYAFRDHWDIDWDIEIVANPEPPAVINWNDSSCMVSKYFSVGEVIQYDPRRIPATNELKELNVKLAYELDKIRKKFGPVGVTSWHRPPAINAAVGGSSKSQHMKAAVDIYLINGGTKELETWAVSNWRGGVGKGVNYQNFVHLDPRSGFPCFEAGPATAVWTY